MVRFFKRQGYQILALGRRAKADVPARLFEFADYATYEECEGLKIECETLIHTAGLASESASAHRLLHANVEITQTIFQNFSPGHFIFISSASVYPQSKVTHQEDEDLRGVGISNYGRSKLQAEKWLMENCGNTQLTILRPRAIYGIGDRVLLPRLARLKKGSFYLKPHPLDYKISMTCIELLLEVTQRIIKGKVPEEVLVLNVADLNTYRLNEVFEKVASLSSAHSILIIPETMLRALAGLGLSKNITKESLQYFLTNHSLDTTKLIQNSGEFESPGFSEYFGKLEAWVNRIGYKNLTKAEPDLPWNEHTCDLS